MIGISQAVAATHEARPYCPSSFLAFANSRVFTFDLAGVGLVFVRHPGDDAQGGAAASFDFHG